MADETDKQIKKRGIYRYKSTNKALFLYLMDQIYFPRHTVSINGYSVPILPKYDVIEEDQCLSLYDLTKKHKRKMEVSHIYLGTGNTTEDGEIKDIDIRRYYWRDNSIPEIVKYFQNIENEFKNFTHDYNEKIMKECPALWRNIRSIDGKFSPPMQYHTIKKILDKEQFFERTDSISRQKNLKLYFPKEDKETFIKFINSLNSAKALEYFEEYSQLFETRYVQICLNKQFVLDILKDNNVVIDYCMRDVGSTFDDGFTGEIMGRTHDFQLILDGRFQKRYEVKKTEVDFINLFTGFRDYCVSKKRIDINGYFKSEGSDYRIKDVKSQIIPKELIDEFKKSTDKAKQYLDEDLIGRKSFPVKGAVKDAEKYAVTIFDTDPDGTYREEDPWSDIIDFDIDEIGNIEVVRNVQYIKPQSEKELNDLHNRYGEGAITSNTSILSTSKIKLSEIIDVRTEYPRIMNGIIVPILSLIQFSPSALFYFVCEQDKWAPKTKDDHDTSKEKESVVHLNYNELICAMTKKALKDYMNDKTMKRVFPIKCSIVGNVVINNEFRPSVLTFTAEKGCNIMFTWSEDLNSSRSEKIWPVIEGHKCYDEQLMKIMDISSSVKFEKFYDIMKKLLVEHPFIK